ncbi:MAG: hypothetical protein ACM3RX_03500, partial [Methanococcaceae archaeon]
RVFAEAIFAFDPSIFPETNTTKAPWLSPGELSKVIRTPQPENKITPYTLDNFTFSEDLKSKQREMNKIVTADQQTNPEAPNVSNSHYYSQNPVNPAQQVASPQKPSRLGEFLKSQKQNKSEVSETPSRDRTLGNMFKDSPHINEFIDKRTDKPVVLKINSRER